MSKKAVLLASRALESPPREGGFVLLKDIGSSIDDIDIHMLSSSATPEGRVQPEKVYTRTGWDALVKIQFFIGMFMTAHKYALVHTAHIPTLQNVRLLRLATWRAHRSGTKFLQTITGLPKIGDDKLAKLAWGDYIVCQAPTTLKRISNVTKRPTSLIAPWPSPTRLATDQRRRNKTRKSLQDQYGIRTQTIVTFPGEFERMGIDASFSECIRTFLTFRPNSLILLACRFDTLGIGDAIAADFPDHVISLGSTNNIIELMEASDLVIFPTRKMDSKFHPPLIITEALSLGTPVLVSDLIDMDIRSNPGLYMSASDKQWSHFAKAMDSAINQSVTSKPSNQFLRMASAYGALYKKVLGK